MTSESSNHFYRNRKKFSDWQAVVIYTSRSKEQKDIYPFRAILNSDQFHRIYLDELGDAKDLPLGVALMALTVEKRKHAKQTAQHLADRVKNEITDPVTNRAIMEMLTTIVVYTFNNLSRIEVEKMLGVDITLQETRFYKEVKAEGEVIGKELGIKEGKTEGQRSLLLTQLDRKLGKLPVRTTKKIAALDLVKLEALAIALLDFTTIADLETWLKQK